MVQNILRQLFQRDLQKLHGEIMLYAKEQNIWQVRPGISNSAGNLCLHLVGNLNTYIGATLGGTAYIRNREAEFSLKNIPREVLLKNISDTMQVVDVALASISTDRLELDYPLDVFEKKLSTGFFLLHLSTHLAYHLGQVNYHRRMIDV
jgi:uncharacterized damage-inducible protein DinB